MRQARPGKLHWLMHNSGNSSTHHGDNAPSCTTSRGSVRCCNPSTTAPSHGEDLIAATPNPLQKAVKPGKTRKLFGGGGGTSCTLRLLQNTTFHTASFFLPHHCPLATPHPPCCRSISTTTYIKRRLRPGTWRSNHGVEYSEIRYLVPADSVGGFCLLCADCGGEQGPEDYAQGEFLFVLARAN